MSLREFRTFPLQDPKAVLNSINRLEWKKNGEQLCKGCKHHPLPATANNWKVVAGHLGHLCSIVRIVKLL